MKLIKPNLASLHLKMKNINKHNAPNSLISQCDYRPEPRGFWNENGRFVLNLYETLM